MVPKQNNTPSEDDVVYIENLVKTFKKNQALKGISFSIKKGELFGFLGLNGAGKTTTLNIILGLLKRDSGTVLISGQNIDKDITKIRNEVGIVFQESIMDPILSVYENLMVRASLYKGFFKDTTVKDVVEDIIKEFQLEEIRNRPYAKLSGGQKRRVDIARALVHKPSILFLDEPTTGLDPNSRKLVWKILNQIQKQRNLTIMLTTHYMEEADNCDRVIIIKSGEILEHGTPAQLKSIYSKTKLIVYKANEDWKARHQDSKNIDNKLTFEFENFEKGSQFLKENIEFIEDYEFYKGTMDEVFLNVTEGNIQND
ncbi:ABC transporter ATP-binding protein [[Mycoplasma] gypis]|uniref:ABC transporter ATP-binding protein n=1 Tax=[Mycoplasma] gypis TaxID=92404 RepID=A0ABZ2RW25_9BACT|nr:ABC transporter ATP-binding protein [[Mycoplasma] gypis]MBN0919653.1 ABC transporter ATP-binding protein [[Mycoplasma] gypis]